MKPYNPPSLADGLLSFLKSPGKTEGHGRQHHKLPNTKKEGDKPKKKANEDPNKPPENKTKNESEVLVFKPRNMVPTCRGYVLHIRYIVEDREKFHSVIENLGEETVATVQEIISNPPDTG